METIAENRLMPTFELGDIKVEVLGEVDESFDVKYLDEQYAHVLNIYSKNVDVKKEPTDEIKVETNDVSDSYGYNFNNDFKANISPMNYSSKLDTRFNQNVSNRNFHFSTDQSRTIKNPFFKMPAEKTDNFCKNYVCLICYHGFPCEELLAKHIKNHSPKKGFRCQICKKSFFENKDLENHMSQVHSVQNKIYKCIVCAMPFKDLELLSNHIRSHAGKKPHKCTICGKTFAILDNLNRHMKSHNKIAQSPEMFIISELKNGKFYEYMKSLEKFRNLKDKRKLVFNNNFAKAEVKFKKPEEEKVCKVPIHKEKKYKCPICHKSFSMKVNLNIHIRTHTGEKPYRCVVCYKLFNQTGNLKRHMTIHSGIKQFHCDYCKKSFCMKEAIIQHIRIHTGEKYICNLCNIAFSDAGNYSRHMKMHKDDPYKCYICKKSYARKGSLNNHMRGHTVNLMSALLSSEN